MPPSDWILVLSADTGEVGDSERFSLTFGLRPAIIQLPERARYVGWRVRLVAWPRHVHGVWWVPRAGFLTLD
jgi:hypothetical protein